MENNNILYSSVNLDTNSVNILKDVFEGIIPKGYDIYMHHMTIMFGGIPPNMENMVGKEVELVINGVGIGNNKDIIALRVNDVKKYSVNKIPHITIAAKTGVKPFESNNINKWYDITPFSLTGIITINRKND